MVYTNNQKRLKMESSLDQLLQDPSIRHALDRIAQAAAPDAAPMDAKDVLTSTAILQREQTAARLREALSILKCAPVELERAAGLERMTGLTRPKLNEETTQTTPEENKEAELVETPKAGRGGKREGAGRKPQESDQTPDPDMDSVAKSIKLKAFEWNEIDIIADDKETTRSGVIRQALEALKKEKIDIEDYDIPKEAKPKSDELLEGERIAMEGRYWDIIYKAWQESGLSEKYKQFIEALVMYGIEVGKMQAYMRTSLETVEDIMREDYGEAVERITYTTQKIYN